jgi:hypothetical protein
LSEIRSLAKAKADFSRPKQQNTSIMIWSLSVSVNEIPHREAIVTTSVQTSPFNLLLHPGPTISRPFLGFYET